MVFAVFLWLASCGHEEPGDLNATPLVPINNTIATLTLEPVPMGDHMGVILVALAKLPGRPNWAVVSADGTLYLHDASFRIIKQFNLQELPGLRYANPQSMIADTHYLYVYLGLGGSWDGEQLPDCKKEPCEIKLIRFDIDALLYSTNYKYKTLASFAVENPWSHQGGGMVFYADGVILGTGDDGGGDYIPADSQDLNEPLAKIYYIDLKTKEHTIIGYGVRNVFTMIRDASGLFFGNVGAETYEEINYLSFAEVDRILAGSVPPVNFGWPIQEGFGEFGREPMWGFARCDKTFENQDPGVHVKLHNGVEHPCGDEIVTVLGSYPVLDDQDPYDNMLDGTIFYANSYAGWLRGFEYETAVINDRHLSHQLGAVKTAIGDDQYVYGVSMWGTDQIVKFMPVKGVATEN